jgi:hypothetical protein
MSQAADFPDTPQGRFMEDLTAYAQTIITPGIRGVVFTYSEDETNAMTASMALPMTQRGVHDMICAVMGGCADLAASVGMVFKHEHIPTIAAGFAPPSMQTVYEDDDVVIKEVFGIDDKNFNGDVIGLLNAMFGLRPKDDPSL